MHVLLLSLGSCFDPHSSSGTPYNLYKGIQAAKVKVSFASADLSITQKWINRIVSFHPNKSIWREKNYKNKFCFTACSSNANREIRNNLSATYILQFQTMFSPYLKDSIATIPYGIYTDYTIAKAQKEYPLWTPFSTQKQYEWWFQQEKRVFANAMHVFTFSEPIRQSIIHDYQISASKVFNIRAGGDFILKKQKARCAKVKKIICVGKDYHRKGISFLLEAFAKISKEFKGVELVIVGCQLPANQQNVTNIPYLEDRDVLEKIYSESDIFVMPSIAEPFGYAFLEAMGSGIPCIGTNVGGVPDIIRDGETGFVVPVKDANAIYEKIKFFIEQPQKVNDFGEAGFKRFQKYYTWENVVNDILKIIQ